MPTMIYKNKAGKRVSSVTTINKNIGWSGRPLMIWANRLGLDGIDLDSPEARKAADVGTIGHRYGELWLTECKANPKLLPAAPGPDASDLEKQGYAAFLSLPRWWEQQRLTVVATELSLVSEAHQFGGTMDLVARDASGALHVIDFKTGKDIYAEHLLQVAAYGRLYAECCGETPAHFALLRWGRDGDFHHHSYQNLDLAWEGFLLARRLHDLHKLIDP